MVLVDMMTEGGELGKLESDNGIPAPPAIDAFLAFGSIKDNKSIGTMESTMPVPERIQAGVPEKDSVPSSKPERTGYCEDKAGILMIQGGDGEAAVGTLFFIYIVNHLIYADQNNLLPWIYLNPVYPCYDPKVHGNETKIVTMMLGAKESKITGEGEMTCNYWKRPQYYPGPIE
eukprot:CAMPEP_0119027470 /NCGR_PEP_ID=MMETSP1176-20130426/37135_1 /TAXON_ID=265551 /ORGANISM="Synedropsis recta cf, Strain CCMP1620" /LENGTH=173 /DNA_ID=CAMNT_0006983395 /DNA_START=47 /DNA_END=565 /DNA_ORIENTATION=+